MTASNMALARAMLRPCGKEVVLDEATSKQVFVFPSPKVAILTSFSGRTETPMQPYT